MTNNSTISDLCVVGPPATTTIKSDAEKTVKYYNEIDFENVGTDSKVNYFDFFLYLCGLHNCVLLMRCLILRYILDGKASNGQWSTNT